MNLHILGSNSFGNCYVLETDYEALILEAGVRMSNVRKALRWKMSKVVGAIITHEHNDHAGHVAEMARDQTCDADARRRLLEVGGKQQVPCLFIDGEPLYESADIIRWIEAHL